jgi:hypothetical protein
VVFLGFWRHPGIFPEIGHNHFYILIHYWELILPVFKKISWWVMWRIAYRVLVGRPEGKKPLWRPRCRDVDNIKIDL